MDNIKQFEPLFGEWYVLNRIGAGSYGTVYRIYREEFGTQFYSALKHISIPRDDDERTELLSGGMDNNSVSSYYKNLAGEMYSEITLMNKLRGHTNIVGYEDSKVIPKPGGVGYDIFIRMELLQSLTNRMAQNPLSKDETVRLGIDICNALIRCNRNNIIHRDIKPDNIFISGEGDFKLGDFGIARTLEKNADYMSKKGTLSYMAPEVYKGEEYGAACDIYSLGMVLYRLLNRGRMPFMPTDTNQVTAADKERAIMRRYSGAELPMPCDANDELGEIVLKACAFRPEDRYASAEEMREDLISYQRGEPTQGILPPSVPPHKPSVPHDEYTETQRMDPVPSGKPPVMNSNQPEESEPGGKPKIGLIIGITLALAPVVIAILAAAGVFNPIRDATPEPKVTPYYVVTAVPVTTPPVTTPPVTTPPVTTPPVTTPPVTPMPNYVTSGSFYIRSASNGMYLGLGSVKTNSSGNTGFYLRTVNSQSEALLFTPMQYPGSNECKLLVVNYPGTYYLDAYYRVSSQFYDYFRQGKCGIDIWTAGTDECQKWLIERNGDTYRIYLTACSIDGCRWCVTDLQTDPDVPDVITLYPDAYPSYKNWELVFVSNGY